MDHTPASTPPHHPGHQAPSHQAPIRLPGDPRLPTDPRLALRVVTMPRETNPYGTIFGGVILSYIDQAGLVEAIAHAPCTWVTASIERVDFRSPVELGDIVSFYTRTLRMGTTSVRIGVDVDAERRMTRELVRVTTAELTMVALGQDGKTRPFRDMASPGPSYRPGTPA